MFFFFQSMDSFRPILGRASELVSCPEMDLIPHTTAHRLVCVRACVTVSGSCSRARARGFLGMGRRHLIDPRQATHDTLTHEPSRSDDRNRDPHGGSLHPTMYADTALGGAKYDPPRPLGHHEMSDRFRSADSRFGGRPAGASREEIAPRSNHWSRDVAYAIYADSETLDGSVSQTQEAARRGRGNTTTHLSFKPCPAQFETKVELPKRHPADTTIVIKHLSIVGDAFADEHHKPISENLGAFAEQPAARRPFPPPISTLTLGHAGPSIVTTAHAEHFATARVSHESRSRGGAGSARSAQVSRHNLITGAARFVNRDYACAYEHHGASQKNSQNLRHDGNTHNGNGDPLLAMRPSKKGFGVTPAAYDIVTGLEVGVRTEKNAFEHPGVKRAGPGLAVMNSGSRREVIPSDNPRDGGKKRIDTTPW